MKPVILHKKCTRRWVFVKVLYTLALGLPGQHDSNNYLRASLCINPLYACMCIRLHKYVSAIGCASRFSTCWRWACLDSSFRAPDLDIIKPYTLT